LSVAGAVLAAFAAVPPVEWVAAGLALAYLLLAIRQNSWCWACAIASAVLYLSLFARAGLQMQAALQVFYIAMAVYGWRAWRGTAAARPLAISRWPAQRHALAIAAVVAVATVNGWLVARAAPPALLPYVDALIAWGSVLATWMVARKLIENWWYWIVLDLAAALLFARQGLVVTALLFLVYTGLAFRGLLQWRMDERAAAARGQAGTHA
jgi:nicotinamide mononucleotide transporter